MENALGIEEAASPPAIPSPPPPDVLPNTPPPPPPDVLPNMETELIAPTNYSIISRPGVGTAGKQIPLLANLFEVKVDTPDAVFYQYSVTITSEDKRAVESKGIGRKLIDRLYQTYSSELGAKKFAYDGERALYTVGPLSQNKFEFKVLLEESYAKCNAGSPSANGNGIHIEETKRSKHSLQSKAFTVEISFAAKIPMQSISLSLEGTGSDADSQDTLRVLDTVLRQRAANRGCLLVRQSFFTDDSRNCADIGGGVTRIRGFHSSFRLTQGGLFLNMDVSTTMILKPGPVIEFLLSNQNVKEPRYIDWAKAKRMLNNLRVRATHLNQKFKISGLSDKPCIQQLFSMKVKNEDTNSAEQTENITVYEYFAKYRGIELTSSAYLPCLNVGKPNRPIYLPFELCSLVPLQRYSKALSPMQRTSFVEQSRQKPQDRVKMLTDAVGSHGDDSVLAACGISIDKQLTQVEGRVLETPKLKVGKNEDCFPQNGRWNFNKKKLLRPSHIDFWAVVNFSAPCDTSYITRELIKCGMSKGINIERPYTLIEEEAQMRRANPVARVEKMFDLITSKLTKEPKLILCVLPERKNCDIYGPWKKKCLSEFGVVTQCISPVKVKITDQYLTNVLLKINSKLGGINSLLAIEHSGHLPLVKDTPTMIIGMDVSHGSPGRSDIPSVAAVVGSRKWPLISRYRASVRTQSSKAEIIDALYKPLDDGKDYGIIRELLEDFYLSSGKRKPMQIIVFRDGVSESQFKQVLDIELNQIKKAYKHLDGVDLPKFTVIVAQKNHHRKLFQANSLENVPPGTVVDKKIVHPRNYDFYMCAHAGMIGTARPVHYHVLLDEIGFSPDGLQNLIHSLSYVNQRSSFATSIVAPISYAHHAAAQMAQMLNFDDLSETSSSLTSDGNIPIPELPKLHENVKSSMFFC